MPEIKKPIIDYSSRDFASIKRDLINYAQKYYPETFRDFNEASFGSLMLDMVAYVGDIVSFYTDYQANESYLETSLELANILKIVKQYGYRYRPNASAFGEVSFFVTIPASLNGASPNYSYAPILRKNSTFSSKSGNLFTLVEDIDFSETEDAILVGSSNAAGTAPTRFALKAKGVVVSGELATQTFNVGDYKKFLKLELFDSNFTEIVSVFDSKGNNYYEVDYLSQDVVYVPVLNTNDNKNFAKNIYKPISVPRRFTAEPTLFGAEIQFGYGTDDNEEKFLDPTTMALDIFGKDHITEKSFDPTVLTKTTKLGITPSNTIVTVVYRRNTATSVNAPVDTIVDAVDPIFSFINSNSLLENELSLVRNSLELTNEKQINGGTNSANPDAEEIKVRAKGAYSSQYRAVTKDDYISLCYNMPSNFGQIKKANILKDQTSFNGKNLNLYVLSVNNANRFVTTNDIVKQNLRNWINQYKMIGDTIDILDGRIINLQIDFEVVSFANINKFDVINDCINTLSSFFVNRYYDFGEPFKITDVYKLLNNIPSVVDTKLVTVSQKQGFGYSSYSVSYDDMISKDGRYLIPPENTVFEIKFPSADINGEVI